MTANLGKLALSQATVDAEAAVLGGCIVAPRLLRDLALEVDSFGHWPHRVVFEAMRNLEAKSSVLDVLTLELELDRMGKLDAVGGVALLGALALHVPTVDNVHEYARRVADDYTKRRVAVTLDSLLARARSEDLTGDELLTDAVKALGAIDGAKPDLVSSIGDLARRRMADIERMLAERAAGGKPITGFPTGVALLDAKLGGWQPGVVNVIAARPAMGKSALALATADACSAAGIGVHVFSLEDSWTAYADRALSRRSQVSAQHLRRVEIDQREVAPLANARMFLMQRKHWLVDDRGGLTAAEIVRAVRRHAERNQTRVVEVDYLQLVKKRDSRMTEYEHLGEVMGTFAEAAKVDDMAYVALSQLNRDIEKRPDKRPTLSDLRGSGELEEKCKVAVGLYRGSYYGGKPKREVDYECECPEAVKSCSHAPTLEQWEKQAQICLLKNNNGATGVVPASWHGPTVEIW